MACPAVNPMPIKLLPIVHDERQIPQVPDQSSVTLIAS